MRQVLDLPLGLSCCGTSGMAAAGRTGTDLNLSTRLRVWVPALFKTYHHMTQYAGKAEGSGVWGKAA